MNERKKLLNIVGLIFLVSTLCYNGAYASNDKQELKKAASKYWNSRLTGDVVTCYQLEEPAFQKKVPLSQYAKGGNIIYKEVKVDGIEIQGEDGIVKVKIAYIIPGFGSRMVFPDTVIDKWKKVEGKWYHVMRSGNPKRDKIGTEKKPKERR